MFGYIMENTKKIKYNLNWLETYAFSSYLIFISMN